MESLLYALEHNPSLYVPVGIATVAMLLFIRQLYTTGWRVSRTTRQLQHESKTRAHQLRWMRESRMPGAGKRS